jgi:hypothetical protein
MSKIAGDWYGSFGEGTSYDCNGTFHFFRYEDNGRIHENERWGEVPLCGDHRTFTSVRMGECNQPIDLSQLCRKCSKILETLKNKSIAPANAGEKE